MNKIFKLLLLSATLNTVFLTTSAWSEQACFMVDADGNPLDLSHICQQPTYRSKPVSNPQFIPKPYIFTVPGNIPQANYERGVYTVPIKRRRAGIPVIDVKFNDKYIFEMMLDTGASTILLTQQMAKILKVEHRESVRVSTPSNSTVYFSSGYVNSVETAGIASKNMKVLISPAIDMGLLGQSFFGLYDVTIKQNVVEFRER